MAFTRSRKKSSATISAQITVSYPTGGVCTCSKGSTSMTATTNPYTFTVDDGGVWTVTCVKSGVTITELVTINDSEPKSMIIPNGENVTPIDSAPILLACADVWDSTATLSDILEDSTLLTSVVSSSNAMSYLARSTGFAVDVTSDETAMGLIGANNTASNKVLANNTWVVAINDSTYFESILNTKVPRMTGAKAPSGEALASSEYSSSYAAYRSFGTPRWASKDKGNQYIQYRFDNKFLSLKKVVMDGMILDGTNRIKNFAILGSSDLAEWHTLYTGINPEDSDYLELDIINNEHTNDIAFELFIFDSWSSIQASISSLQFYGRSDV